MTAPSQQPGTGEETASRRHFLLGGMIAAASLPPLDGAHAADTVRAAHAGGPASPAHPSRSVTANDGAQIYVKDWGAGRPIVFSHGWPLNADVWDDQMMVVAANGFRGVAFDRRGHGRSSQTWHGNDYDTFAEDLAALMTALDLRGAVMVGHSAGAGDVARYIGRHGTRRIGGVVLVSAIPPLMLKTAANPVGVPLEAFDGIRAAVVADRAQFYRELGDGPFFGANRPGSRVSQGVRDAFWLWCMQVGLRASFEGIKAFSETDFTKDLKRFDVPTLIIHGDDDQNVPIAATARVSSRLIATATLKIYPGAPHGLTVTHRAQFDDDLMTFVKTLP